MAASHLPKITILFDACPWVPPLHLTNVDDICARPLRARDEFWKQVEMGAKSVPPMIASNRLDFAKLT